MDKSTKKVIACIQAQIAILKTMNKTKEIDYFKNKIKELKEGKEIKLKN